LFSSYPMTRLTRLFARRHFAVEELDRSESF
jgi:hypothetical protein